MKMKRNKKGLGLSSSKGFTLIEVVLVLAIGGLIFLLAFLAFQQVQTNRRDTQRRSDAGRMLAELQNYKGDKGSYPAQPDNASAVASGGAVTPATTAKVFYDTYMGGADFENPTGTAYNVIASTATPAKDVTTYYIDRKCSDLTEASSGNIAVVIGLEKGVVCRDDS